MISAVINSVSNSEKTLFTLDCIINSLFYVAALICAFHCVAFMNARFRSCETWNLTVSVAVTEYIEVGNVLFVSCGSDNTTTNIIIGNIYNFRRMGQFSQTV